MHSKLPLKLFALLCWLGLGYALRFYLMENLRWVDICGGVTTNPACALRAGVGVTIHFQVLAWIAIITAVPAFFIAGKLGRTLAWISLVFALPALTLYTVTLAVFALLIAGLRLVRNERHNASANNADTAAQPSA
ncbi:MAG: hypothetical protein JWM78_2179 [Verrucomicrobiaceae bacterium]|nr:hypothetical protein [Verrucomicrobiaceae bacterium]